MEHTKIPAGIRRVVTDVKRLRNSANSNPRFRVTFDSGHAFNTATDAAFALELPLWGDLTGEWLVLINGRGTISDMNRIPTEHTCWRGGCRMEPTTEEADRRVNILFRHAEPCRVPMTETEMCQ